MARKSKLQQALEAIDEEWNEAEAGETGGFDDLPNGKYAVRIDGATVNQSKASGRLQVSFTMTVVDGDHAGRKVWKHEGIEGAQSLGYFKTSLARIEVDPPAKIKDLPATLEEEVVGAFCQITLKTKGEYQNAYFDKALDGEDFDLEGLEEIGEDGDIEVGSRVMADYDGELYPGEVTELDDEEAIVTFDDGDTLKCDPSELQLIPEEGDEEEEEEGEDEEEEEADEKALEDQTVHDFEIDMEVSAEFDGEEYTGTVQAVGDKRVTVLFEGDEEPELVDPTELTIVSNAANEEEEEEEEGEDEGEDETEYEEADEGPQLHFEKFTKAHITRLHKAAEECEFDPEDYEDLIELAAEVAEYCGMSGDWSKPLDFIKDLEAALEDEE